MLHHGDYSGYHSIPNNITDMSAQWYTPPPGVPGMPGPSFYNIIEQHPPSNSREQRNFAEKKRRDKINSFITQLAALVPMVSNSAKRMDKTSILRLTATHLRLHQTLLQPHRPHITLPKILDQFVLEQLVFEQLGGFLLITNQSGKIIFISHTVENLLGYLQTDLMGKSLYNITSPEEHDKLKMYLNSEGELNIRWKKYFHARFKRAGPRAESPVYETVKIVCASRPTNCGASSSSSTCSDDYKSSACDIGNDVLLFFVRVVRPEPITERLLEASKEEYVTRHLIDGRIINCDHRISLIAGYMSQEVSGLSAFKFMHKEDVRWVMIALRQMYDRGETKGSSCYRLMSRNGQFIYLRTFGFLEIDDQGIVESFICVNTVVCEREGLHMIQEMKEKYSAIIKPKNETLTTATSTDRVEDPQEVDKAIIHLITNLPSPGADQRSTPSPKFVCPTTMEKKDCISTHPTDTSPKKYHPKLRTVLKRPHSTESNLNIYKRFKTSPQPQLSPIETMPSEYLSPTHTQMPDFTLGQDKNRQQQPPDQSMYAEYQTSC